MVIDKVPVDKIHDHYNQNEENDCFKNNIDEMAFLRQVRFLKRLHIYDAYLRENL